MDDEVEGVVRLLVANLRDQSEFQSALAATLISSSTQLKGITARLRGALKEPPTEDLVSGLVPEVLDCHSSLSRTLEYCARALREYQDDSSSVLRRVQKLYPTE